MAEIVFVHGRSQQKKDPAGLKAEWITAWRKGLEASNLPMPIAAASIRFPFYGDALDDLVHGAPDPARVIIKGAAESTDERGFLRAVLEEVRQQIGITDAEILAIQQTDLIEKGVENWEWVQSILKAIDRRLPGGSAGSIALATHDVFVYLRNSGIRDEIENGVREAFTPGVPTVVVSHSLGTVVAYNLLRREGKPLGWNVPLFVTLGSPLAVGEIHRVLAPHKHPECVGHWLNAMDERDVVALYPLTRKNFSIDPEIENQTDVRNDTGNHHGIPGYLGDPVVARRIHEALKAANSTPIP